MRVKQVATYSWKKGSFESSKVEMEGKGGKRGRGI